MKEIWRHIYGYTALYLVSNHGRVQSFDRVTIHKNGNRHVYRGMILKATARPYPQVCLFKNGKGKNFWVHALVAKAFIGNLPRKGCVNHKDGDKANNRVENLEYTTIGKNVKHAHGLGLMSHGSKHPFSKLKEEDVINIRNLVKNGLSCAKAGAKYGVSEATAWKICKGKSWRHVK